MISFCLFVLFLFEFIYLYFCFFLLYLKTLLEEVKTRYCSLNKSDIHDFIYTLLSIYERYRFLADDYYLNTSPTYYSITNVFIYHIHTWIKVGIRA